MQATFYLKLSTIMQAFDGNFLNTKYYFCQNRAFPKKSRLVSINLVQNKLIGNENLYY